MQKILKKKKIHSPPTQKKKREKQNQWLQRNLNNQSMKSNNSIGKKKFPDNNREINNTANESLTETET